MNKTPEDLDRFADAAARMTGARNAYEPDVGVLLPVRLETRFYPPDDGHHVWRMRVLVVPDEPSIDRHDPLPLKSELESVKWLWEHAPDGLDTDAGQTAWQQFAAHHGAARAAWLARTFPPTDSGEIEYSGQVRDEPLFSCIHGFPEQIELWMARKGDPPTHVATSTVDTGLLTLDFPDPEDPDDQRWWSSWEIAQKVGLGIEVELETVEPNDIDVLYVVGLSTTEPAPLFLAHRDFGSLGLIAPGTPTNTVDGEPAVDLGHDPETWRQWLLTLEKKWIGPASEAVSGALTGRPDLLGHLPGDEFVDHPTTGRLLVQALWTVLWGHALKDIWNLSGVYEAGLWAGQFMSPEGPLPSLRIRDQPYGLLPTTCLKGFVPSDSDPDLASLEERISPYLVEAQTLWAKRAEGGGNVSGADTERLLELLGRPPSANAYAYRLFADLPLIQTLYGIYAGSILAPALQQWWLAMIQMIQQILASPVEPVRHHVSAGWPQDLRIPLVAPERIPRDMAFADFLGGFIDPDALIRRPPEAEEWLDKGERSPFRKLPDSLLAHLLVFAKLVTAAEVHRYAMGRHGSVLEPLRAQVGSLTELAFDALEMKPEELGKVGAPPQVYTMFLNAIRGILRLSVGELERALRAVLDTAAYRIDPWITAFAWRRLQESIAAEHPFHLGLYGWVDAPKPGTPGPTAGGLLHAPSHQQALAAIIMRDKAIHDPEEGRWDINLESSTIRLAARFAEEVRLGSHIGEVLGREVERIAGSQATIEALRTDYPLRAEHAGRRVCDGQAVLAADPKSLSLDEEQIAALEALRRAMDTYGDLLVAEGIYHVVAGHGTVASAAMDAAAGLTAPPDLEVISTRRTGHAAITNVVIALPPPAEEPATAFDSSPGEIADSAAAAYVNTTLVPTNAAPWLWPVLTESGPIDICLSDIGLTPIDTLALSEEELVRLVLMIAQQQASTRSLLNVQWSVQLPDGTVDCVHLSDLNLSIDEILSRTEVDLADLALNSAPEGSTMLGVVLPEGTKTQRRARRIVQILGRQPAVPADLIDPDKSPGDAQVRDELRTRYQSLWDVAQALRDQLILAVSGPEDGLPDALILAARWGITPVVQVDDTLVDRVRRAGEALQERIDRAPLQADITDLDAPGLATAIAELAAPEGHLAVLGRVQLSSLPAFTAEPTLDAEWLAVNAAVREPLARLETYQLEGLLSGSGAQLEAWTNRPGDPWQLDVPDSEDQVKVTTRLVAVYGPAGVLQGGTDTIAVGLLDSWGETVPDVDQSTTAAFGFDAPAARAPQAILLAVPPEPDQALTCKVLVNILAETRELAHARMATPGQLGLAAALPTMMFPRSGITGVPLWPKSY